MILRRHMLVPLTVTYAVRLDRHAQSVIGTGTSATDCDVHFRDWTLAWIMHEEPILGETQEPPCGTNVVPTTF